MESVYLSPSIQEHNVGIIPGYIEENVMNMIADVMEPLLKANDIIVYRNDRSWTATQNMIDSNLKKPSIHVAIHSNAGGGEGTVIFYSLGSTKGLRLAQGLYDQIAPLSPGKDRGVIANTTFVEVNKTIAPATLIEVAFHDNVADTVWILANIREIAIGLCKGIMAYFYRTLYIPDDSLTVAPDGMIYRVRTGAFRIMENADRRVDDLQRAGFPDAYVKLEKK